MTNIQLFIFDLDGTIIDAYGAVTKGINLALKELDLPPTDVEMVKRKVGWGERDFLLNFVGEEKVDLLQDIYRQYCRGTLEREAKLLDGAKELLQSLKSQNYKIAVATNRPRHSTDIVLSHLGIKDMFDYIVCGDEVTNLKPDGEILEKVLNHFLLKGQHAYYVGDMTVDIETGKNAGVRTIAVTTGSSTKQEIEACEPFMILDQIIGLKDIL